jgi:hypothetical protein
VKVSFVEIWFLVQSCALPGCASCDVAKVAPGTVEVDTTKTVRDEIATYFIFGKVQIDILEKNMSIFRNL